MKKLKSLFTTNYGRYILGMILALTAVFSEYGTIEIITTDWGIFKYTSAFGVILILAQFIYHIGLAIFHYRKKWK